MLLLINTTPPSELTSFAFVRLSTNGAQCHARRVGRSRRNRSGTHNVVGLVSKLQPTIHSTYDKTLADVTASALSISAGVDVGTKVANNVLKDRNTDGTETSSFMLICEFVCD
jgi:hypothetical protein